MTVDKISQKDTSGWLKKEASLGQMLFIFMTMMIVFGTAWITVKSDIEVLKVEVIEMRDDKKEIKSDIKFIKETLVQILVSLEGKKNRDD